MMTLRKKREHGRMIYFLLCWNPKWQTCNDMDAQTRSGGAIFWCSMAHCFVRTSNRRTNSFAVRKNDEHKLTIPYDLQTMWTGFACISVQHVSHECLSPPLAVAAAAAAAAAATAAAATTTTTTTNCGWLLWDSWILQCHTLNFSYIASFPMSSFSWRKLRVSSSSSTTISKKRRKKNTNVILN